MSTTVLKGDRQTREASRGGVCPACECAEWLDAWPIGREQHQLRRCQGCDLVYSHPMQAADPTWYSSSWLYGLRHSHREPDQRIVPWNFARALAVLRSGTPGRLLDVGCAEGLFLELARHADYEVTGLDFNPELVRMARERLGVGSIYPSAVEEVGKRFPEAQFDVITIFEVLEHVADPCGTLRSIQRVLKPGGRLLLSVPGNRRWPLLFDPEADTPPHHLTLWTEMALRRLLERADFRVHTIHAKPLGPDDLGIHLKWRWAQAARKLRYSPISSKHRFAIGVPSAHSSFGWSALLRRLGWLALEPCCWALRRHPQAGGFTLFAEGEKV